MYVRIYTHFALKKNEKNIKFGVFPENIQKRHQIRREWVHSVQKNTRSSLEPSKTKIKNNEKCSKTR